MSITPPIAGLPIVAIYSSRSLRTHASGSQPPALPAGFAGLRFVPAGIYFCLLLLKGHDFDFALSRYVFT
jgi:hypothetical protein